METKLSLSPMGTEYLRSWTHSTDFDFLVYCQTLTMCEMGTPASAVTQCQTQNVGLLSLSLTSSCTDEHIKCTRLSILTHNETHQLVQVFIDAWLKHDA